MISRIVLTTVTLSGMLFFLAAGGCSTQTPGHPSAKVKFTYSKMFETSLSPEAAAEKISEGLNSLQIFSTPARDYFSGYISASISTGEEIEVVCLRKGAGHTEVRFRSNLPSSCNATLRKNIEEELSCAGNKQKTAIIETSLKPDMAADAVVEALDPFHFGNMSSGSGGLFQTGDYFTRLINAASTTGNSIKVICQWKSEDQTEVRLESDLPDNENELVLEKIRERLQVAEKPATRTSE